MTAVALFVEKSIRGDGTVTSQLFVGVDVNCWYVADPSTEAGIIAFYAAADPPVKVATLTPQSPGFRHNGFAYFTGHDPLAGIQ